MTKRSPGEILFTSSFETELSDRVGERAVVFILSHEVAERIPLSILLSRFSPMPEVIYVPDGERQKNFEQVIAICNRLGEIAFPRDGVIVGIGGGATTDLAGYVASVWMRGVDWIALPTTLAGMVDAAIGGKTGINIDAGKNLVGSFHLPLVTLIDQRFLTTLSMRDVTAGLAEVIKCGFIADPKILEIAEEITEADLLEAGASVRISELLQRGIVVKHEIVSKDLRESGNRAFLNYGHTLGHAIEVAEDFQLRHGEAVAIGMVFAAGLSERLHGLELVSRHHRILQRFGLPVTYRGATFDALLPIMERDKKVKDGKLRFVLLKDVGQPELNGEVPLSMARDLFDGLIRQA